ncbi:hypothetical protein HNQ60_005203 [Povalibacter uvarum]|uniref:Uncharacterized protein n=1 Tax=Povalibacter uvarum TaxID=732238 RepID=A0A841HSC0_9GAMM|nr:hypothetical protein [Povalibacter uvarum]MBB6096281.1 hypothetical protein [Povalibacter uvarum]
MNGKSTMHLACSALGILAFVAIPSSQAADTVGAEAAISQHHSGSNDRKKTNELVKIVRQVTAKYRDVEVAESDNYHSMFGCVSGDSSGAMGLHYVNLGLYADGKIDAYQPEIVIYEPTPSGRPRLIGADYIVDAATWDATHSQAPELNGQIFHYYSAPNRYGLPAFYTLHVWAWKDNPTGAFVNWHQNVSCEAHDGPSK